MSSWRTQPLRGSSAAQTALVRLFTSIRGLSGLLKHVSPGRGKLKREIRAKSGFCQLTVWTIEGHIVVSVADTYFDGARREIQMAFVLDLMGVLLGESTSAQISGAMMKGSFFRGDISLGEAGYDDTSSVGLRRIDFNASRSMQKLIA